MNVTTGGHFLHMLTLKYKNTTKNITSTAIPGTAAVFLPQTCNLISASAEKSLNNLLKLRRSFIFEVNDAKMLTCWYFFFLRTSHFRSAWNYFLNAKMLKWFPYREFQQINCFRQLIMWEVSCSLLCGPTGCSKLWRGLTTKRGRVTTVSVSTKVQSSSENLLCSICPLWSWWCVQHQETLQTTPDYNHRRVSWGRLPEVSIKAPSP